MPKATPFSEDDEKTTIESGGWEEEASTTVEQGEVADKVRALASGVEARRSGSNTNITAATGSGVTDEPTVDDQRAIAALALLPPPSVARLVVTGGNDAGRTLEVRPGKTYTIGRGIDNDLVLTDITASRKHFDIRHDNGTWILADRGSGNGTAVNNRIEDAPFMLASGDTIEVGNTAFRFDLVSSAISLPGLPRELPTAVGRRDAAASGNPASSSGDLPRLNADDADSVDLATPAVGPPGSLDAAPSAGQDPHEVPGVPTFDGSVDDDLELSTVSGKPIPGPESPRPAMTASRPKTLPPPAPLPRPRTQTGRPPLTYAGTRSQAMAAVPQPPIPTGALPAMAPTMAPAMAPTMMAPLPPMAPMRGPALPQPATTMPLPQMANRPPLSPALLDPSLGPLPTTLPGQGPPLPARGPRLPFSYPSASEILSQHGPGGPRGPVHVTAGHPGRDATSTALVQPMSYSGAQAQLAPAPPRTIPPLTRRMKIALGLAAIFVFAAIATIAIVRGASGRLEPVDTAGKAPPPPPSVVPRTPTPPMVTPISPAAPSTTPPTAAGNTAAPTVTPISPAAPSTTPPPAADKAATTAPPAPGVTAVAKAAPAAPPEVAAAEPVPATQPDKVAATEPVPATQPDKVARPPAIDPTPSPRSDARTEPRTDARSEPRGDRKPIRRIETRKPDKKPVEVAAATPRSDTRSDRKHGGHGLQDIKAEAAGLYKTRNFSAAAALLTAAVSGFGSDDAKELKALAQNYSQLGKSYNIGMAPGTKPTEAYQALRRAIDYDHDVGAAYVSELQDRLATTASRAASSYMAAKDYELAFQAVRTAESLGSTSSNNKTVRTLLDDIASDLYRAASSELSSDPEGARKKARQILGIVDNRNPLYARAQKLINAP